MQSTTFEIPLTPRAKKLLAAAQSLARKMGDPYIGTKHLVLSMLTGDLGETKLLVQALGVDIKAVGEKAKLLI